MKKSLTAKLAMEVAVALVPQVLEMEVTLDEATAPHMQLIGIVCKCQRLGRNTSGPFVSQREPQDLPRGSPVLHDTKTAYDCVIYIVRVLQVVTFMHSFIHSMSIRGQGGGQQTD